MAKKVYKNKKILGALIVLAVIAGGAALYIKTSQNNGSKTPTYAPKAADTAEVANRNATSPPKASTPTVQSAEKSSVNGATSITSPHENDTVTSGTSVSGTSSEKSIYYRLKAANNGQIAGTGPMPVSEGKFSFGLLFNKAIKGGSDYGTLQIYSLGSDGSETSIASVNVKIQQ